MASYYTIPVPEDSTPTTSSGLWRAALPAVGAGAAAVAVIGLASTQFTTQHYASVSSSSTAGALKTAPVSLAEPKIPSPSSAQVLMRSQAPFQTDLFTETSAQPGQIAAFTSGAALFIGAAAAMAWQLLGQGRQTAAIALRSDTGEKKEESKEKMKNMVQNLSADDLKLIARGGSMQEVSRSKGIDEIARALKSEQASRADITPKDVILSMQRGNGRFWMGLSERPDMNAQERRALIIAQAPTIAVLSCSDSRVPVEIIFDQGLGEVFVVRMAGNILDANAEGSIEFSVKYLGVKVVLVIGHEGCGAVKGAISMSDADIAKEPPALQAVLNSIKSKLDVAELNLITDGRSRDREAIVLNTSNQVKELQKNKLLSAMIDDGSLIVAGAFYEISSGIVDFFSLDKNGLVVDV